MNFLVWKRGLRGPSPSLCMMDPRASLDWKAIEDTIVAIITLTDDERQFTLDQAVAAHPCST